MRACVRSYLLYSSPSTPISILASLCLSSAVARTRSLLREHSSAWCVIYVSVGPQQTIREFGRSLRSASSQPSSSSSVPHRSIIGRSIPPPISHRTASIDLHRLVSRQCTSPSFFMLVQYKECAVHSKQLYAQSGQLTQARARESTYCYPVVVMVVVAGRMSVGITRPSHELLQPPLDLHAGVRDDLEDELDRQQLQYRIVAQPVDHHQRHDSSIERRWHKGAVRQQRPPAAALTDGTNVNIAIEV